MQFKYKMLISEEGSLLLCTRTGRPLWCSLLVCKSTNFGLIHVHLCALPSQGVQRAGRSRSSLLTSQQYWSPVGAPVKHVNNTVIWNLCLFQHGPVFTIFALGKRFTFVTEEEGTEAFFKSKDLNFEQAVQQAVENAGKWDLALF